MKRGYVLCLTAVAALALLVALFVVVGVAAAEDSNAAASVYGVGNEANDCVDNSCNTGNVADVDVDNDCLIVAVGVAVIDGGGLIINDVCNNTVTVTQSQVFQEKAKEVTPAPAAAAGKGLPVTGAPALIMGLLGSGLSTAGLALWRRRS